MWYGISIVFSSIFPANGKESDLFLILQSYIAKIIWRVRKELVFVAV